MIYLIAIALALLILSHVIYRRGVKEGNISIQQEKTITFITVIACIAAIIEMVDYCSSLSTDKGDEFSGWLPALLGYPLGMLLVLFIIFFVMPPPIPREGMKEQDKESEGI